MFEPRRGHSPKSLIHNDLRHCDDHRWQADTRLELPDGWIRQLTIPTDARVPAAVASWTLTGERGSYTLMLRYQGQTFVHPLLLGEHRYFTPSLAHSDGARTRVELQQVRWFGIVPGVPQLGLAPRLVAYLALVLIITPALKRYGRIG